MMKSPGELGSLVQEARNRKYVHFLLFTDLWMPGGDIAVTPKAKVQKGGG
jgi:hypothetical protein